MIDFRGWPHESELPYFREVTRALPFKHPINPGGVFLPFMELKEYETPRELREYVPIKSKHDLEMEAEGVLYRSSVNAWRIGGFIAGVLVVFLFLQLT